MREEKRMLKGVLVDVKKGEVNSAEILDDLDEFYRVLDCTCIDIVYRAIDGKTFSFICDDEGLLKSNPICSAIDKDEKPMLVGNLLIVSAENDDGELVSLKDDEIEYVLSHVSVAGSLVGKSAVHFHPVITDVEY